MTSTPFFSIIVPMYNRQRVIARALDSCLSQTFSSFEVIVVDDGSRDGSREVVRRYQDPRIKLACHGRNRGVCPARNTGIEASGGQWIVFLDSDDALFADALEIIHRRAMSLRNGIDSLVFNYRRPGGKLSPEPPLVEEIFDYERYVRWMATLGASADYLRCVRKTTFPKVRFPDGRAYELIYALDLSKQFKTKSCTDVVCMKYSDADNQLTTTFELDRAIKDAPDNARVLEVVLARHGQALSRWARARYLKVQQMASHYHFQAGHRVRGTAWALRFLRAHPCSWSTWLAICIGILGPRPVAWIRGLRHWWRQPRRSVDG